MQCTSSFIQFLPLALSATLLACSEENTANGCIPIDAVDFGCIDPGNCLTLKVSWNHPESTMQTGGGFDLLLWIGDNTFIDSIT